MVKYTFDLENDEEQQQWDLKQSFESVDDDKLGILSVDQAYTLVLGLGYLQDYKAQDRFTPQILRDAVKAIRRQEREERGIYGVGDDPDDDGVTLEVLQKVLDVYSSVLHRDRTQNFQQGFELMAGGEKKRSIDASDVRKLAKDLGDPLSDAESHGMITMTKRIVTGRANEDTDNSLDYETFRKFMGAPDDL
jgi:hypothetical protein